MLVRNNNNKCCLRLRYVTIYIYCMPRNIFQFIPCSRTLFTLENEKVVTTSTTRATLTTNQRQRFLHCHTDTHTIRLQTTYVVWIILYQSKEVFSKVNFHSYMQCMHFHLVVILDTSTRLTPANENVFFLIHSFEPRRKTWPPNSYRHSEKSEREMSTKKMKNKKRSVVVPRLSCLVRAQCMMSCECVCIP